MRSLIIAIVVALAAASWTEECQRHCTHDNNHLKADALNSGCETYRYVLPRPKVYRVCKTAFDQAIQQACRKVCFEDKQYGSGHTSHGAHHHCKPHRDTVPKPISHEGCVNGYLSGSRAAIAFANEIQQKHKEAMASSNADAAADAEANAAAEAARAAKAAEAAAAKAKAQAEAAKAKAQAAAEAAEKKKEEEAVKEAAAAKAEAEAAKKAAEEQKAREMEAARAAARAAYSKAQQEEAAAAAAEPAATEPVANLRGGDEVAKE